MERITELVDWTDKGLYFSAACIIFNPVYWNLIGRLEYRYKLVSKITGSVQLGVTIFGLSIFFLGLFRNWRFSEVTRTHPTVDLVNHTYAEYVGWTLMAVGMLLVASSFYRLGFMGTYMGDYFGILLDEKLTGFPFNVVDNPMYWGSTLNFLSIAVMRQSMSGLLLTCLVIITYKMASTIEEPFTDHIYKEKADKEKVL